MAEVIAMRGGGGTLPLFDMEPPPSTPEAEVPDWRERGRALDIGRSWIVEAPAGSGKTGLLIQRYLKLLAEGEVERPEQVLAITFTKAATEEIRQRVMSQLQAAVAGTEVKSAFERETRALAEAVLRRDAQMGWRLLDSAGRLNVRTIDSVCSEIARALPVTSGGNGGVAPVDEPERLYREAARRTLLELGGSDAALSDALRVLLLHRDGSVAECERLIAEMLGAREQWGDLLPLRREELTDEWLEQTVRRRLDRALEVQVCRGLGELVSAIPASTLAEITVLAAEMGHAPGLDGPSPMAVCAGLTQTPGEALEHLEHWQALIHLLIKSEGEWRKGFRSDWLRFTWDPRHTTPVKGLIASLQDQDGVLEAIRRFNKLPPARYPEEQWFVTRALFRVLSRALAELQVVFGERGECDFAESALLARSALRQESGAEGYEAAMGLELRHLLVDEMQDTSTSQYELIERLTEGWGSEGKTAFLVGDPKQSIYLFRQARVERFVAAMETERMGDLAVGRLRLTANFRSQAGLVKGFNREFARVFPEEPGSDVPFVAAAAVRAEAEGVAGTGGLLWHTALARGLPAEISESKRLFAKDGAEMVRQTAELWLSRELPPGRTEPWKVAVLVRSRRELREIVAALKRDDGAGAIPFRAVNVEPLHERREVLDLLALTRALSHPADRVAWWSVLRAPWCGLGLADLHVLAGGDDRAFAQLTVMELVASRGELLGAESIARLERVWPVLGAAMKRRSRLRLPELVERTWRSLGGDAALDETELQNALRYLQLLDELDREKGGVDLAQLKRKMEKLFAAASNAPGAVDLMTIHGAKGLEWDVVLVPELERPAPPVRSRLLEWEEIVREDEDAAEVVIAPIQGKGEEAKALNTWLRGIRSAREAAERRRLFYVACTRAREELHLFGAATVLKDGTVRAEVGSLLEAAWPAAREHFADNLAVMPLRRAPEPMDGLALAAGAEESGDAQAPLLERFPADFDPLARFGGGAGWAQEDDGDEIRARLERPEGSFAARSFGNAMHTFLEVLAARSAESAGADELRAEVAGWKSRIAATLRADGLTPAVVDRLAGRVVSGLGNTLREPVGRWLLASRTDARSEYALTSWSERWSRVRMDRVFRAGDRPEAEGSECLWIVDYKTGSHGQEDVEAFLESERAKYEAQMRRYAEAIGAAETRVGLWYPMVGRLVWWVGTLQGAAELS